MPETRVRSPIIHASEITVERGLHRQMMPRATSAAPVMPI